MVAGTPRVETDNGAVDHVMQARTSTMSGQRSTPLERLLGVVKEKPTALLICDHQYINWGFPDMDMDVKFVVPEDWLLLGFKISIGSVGVSDYSVVGVAVTPNVDRVAKRAVVTWVEDVASSIYSVNSETKIVFVTGLPCPITEALDWINYNRNLAYGIRRWNLKNPTQFVRYCGWHRVLVKLPCPEDGVWEHPEIRQIRDRFLEVARIGKNQEEAEDGQKRVNENVKTVPVSQGRKETA